MLREESYLACLGLALALGFVWDFVCALLWGLACVLPTDPDLPAEAGFGAEAFWGTGLAFAGEACLAWGAAGDLPAAGAGALAVW